MNNNSNGGLFFSGQIKSLLSESGESLIQRQRDSATLYRHRSGTLQESLQGKPFTVTDSGDVQSLLLSYPKHIRAIDRQRTVYGRKKNNYHPIYNRPLYGEIYRYTIPMVRGLVRRMFRQHQRNLKQIFSKPIEL